MKRKAAFILNNGFISFSEEGARKEAEKIYGLMLSRLAHQLIHQEKYTAMMTFIDENLDHFIELKALKDDINLEEEKEND